MLWIKVVWTWQYFYCHFYAAIPLKGKVLFLVWECSWNRSSGEGLEHTDVCWQWHVLQWHEILPDCKVDILPWVFVTEATAYRNWVALKGEHELFNHFHDCCSTFRIDILFKMALLLFLLYAVVRCLFYINVASLFCAKLIIFLYILK